MRLARFSSEGKILLGLVHDAGITSLTDRIEGLGNDMIGLINRWPQCQSQAQDLPQTADYDFGQVTLLAPVARPGKIFGIGLNYGDHIQESGMAKPEVQTWFTKAVTAVNDPYSPIERPLVSPALDYEAELVFIVGKRCRHVPVAQARDVIFGYCVGNDVSVRDWQMRSGQFAIGKSFDTHAPFGPFIVTADEIDVGALAIRCLVNGEIRQKSNTSHLIFSCEDQVAHLSQAMTLEPGDVIFTGTPGGVGAAMKPPMFLTVGDIVRVEIDGIGHIENRVVNETVRSQ